MGEAGAAWKEKGPHKRGATCSADGGRDFSLLNKLVRVTTKKSLSNVGNATFYLLVLKFSAWLQTFHAEWSEMTTGRHFYRPVGSNEFRLNPKLLAKLAKLGTLSIKLLKNGVIFAVVVTHIFKGIWCNLSNVLYSMMSIHKLPVIYLMLILLLLDETSIGRPSSILGQPCCSWWTIMDFEIN